MICDCVEPYGKKKMCQNIRSMEPRYICCRKAGHGGKHYACHGKNHRFEEW